MLFAVMVLLALCYAVPIASFAVGFQRVIRPQQRAAPTALPLATVLVPARNEAAAIAACVTSILENDYPANRFEVLVVDDASTDDTAALVAELEQRYNRPETAPRLRLLRLSPDPGRARAHKKYALEQGVSQAKGSLILTTDADSRVSSAWIHTMAAAFTDDTAFVSGPVLYTPGRRPFFHMQALEFLGLVGIGAGAIGLGRPILCSGANIAYRKDVFEAVGGYRGIDHLTSGDDELLMQKIAAEAPGRVRFCADPRAVVLTNPLPTVRAFFEQRRRWASKGAHYPQRGLILLNLLFYSFFLMLLVGYPAALFFPALWPSLLTATALKITAEATLLGPACYHFRRTWLLRYILPAQPFQVLYILAASTAGALGGYTWKDRSIER